MTSAQPAKLTAQLPPGRPPCTPRPRTQPAPLRPVCSDPARPVPQGGCAVPRVLRPAQPCAAGARREDVAGEPGRRRRASRCHAGAPTSSSHIPDRRLSALCTCLSAVPARGAAPAAGAPGEAGGAAAEGEQGQGGGARGGGQAGAAAAGGRPTAAVHPAGQHGDVPVGGPALGWHAMTRRDTTCCRHTDGHHQALAGHSRLHWDRTPGVLHPWT